jgi:hypothetical protein
MPVKDPAAYAKSPKGFAARARARVKYLAKYKAIQAARLEMPITAHCIQPLLSTWGRS